MFLNKNIASGRKDIQVLALFIKGLISSNILIPSDIRLGSFVSPWIISQNRLKIKPEEFTFPITRIRHNFATRIPAQFISCGYREYFPPRTLFAAHGALMSHRSRDTAVRGTCVRPDRWRTMGALQPVIISSLAPSSRVADVRSGHSREPTGVSRKASCSIIFEYRVNWKYLFI